MNKDRYIITILVKTKDFTEKELETYTSDRGRLMDNYWWNRLPKTDKISCKSISEVDQWKAMIDDSTLVFIVVDNVNKKTIFEYKKKKS